MTLLTSFNQKFTAITADSREVRPGALFLAYPGVSADGRAYVTQAIQAGAAAVLWESEAFKWNAAWQVANAGVANLKAMAGQIAAEFYDYPCRKLSMIGVTGTNGKTSVSQWIAQALTRLGEKTAVIGTIGNGFVNEQVEAINTTPDAIFLQRLLAEYALQDAKAVVMEVSSHGLHQGRVNGVQFDVAVLTNLSRDHLDYHETMEDYAAAKQQLFEIQGLRTAVVNADDAFGQQVAATLKARAKSVLTYGFGQGDVRGEQLALYPHGLTMQVNTPCGIASLHAPVLGRFNAYNVLAVLASLLASNVGLAEAVAVIGEIKSAPGRMQQFGGDDKPMVVVDYAHTPDALENVLTTLREQTAGRLICVFGCGGNRDAGKRPLMGAVATKLAHQVVVTSDNPRNEDPMQIIRQIVAGVTGNYEVEPDRASAIKKAVLMARKEDLVLIAGKGHERYQEVQNVKIPFDDVAHAKQALGLSVAEVMK
ncbi:MAG: UDP-N-acetylmuramoyl-L-alanyl-D-glutamate--2,6-diaminopimelate ligase [Betaproteobacteria bacterium HGW-Betaproteobacteria-22]|nr:MAG: UDP-N-acetylmuramoyl-L-alanyl-D-glutamate--2,6-diaminopimelate ligase [Betaproteobacteria bacterium HGW-Betaproteobacteria-22]